jgi:hypothetical protein
MLELRPLTDHIGMEVLNVDATQPIDPATFTALRDALNTHSVLLLRNQPVTEAQHVAFAREFGELQVHVLSQYLTTPYPELYVLSNVKQDGKPIGNHKEGWNWHSDWSYYEVPCFGSVLHAVEVPPVGADTLFSSMDGGQVTVSLTAGAMIIDDNGPGVSDEALARLGERFWRPPGQTQTGSGLGLSIVKNIAQLHGIRVGFSQRTAGGLRVTLSW